MGKAKEQSQPGRALEHKGERRGWRETNHCPGTKEASEPGVGELSGREPTLGEGGGEGGEIRTRGRPSLSLSLAADTPIYPPSSSWRQPLGLRDGALGDPEGDLRKKTWPFLSFCSGNQLAGRKFEPQARREALMREPEAGHLRGREWEQQSPQL